MPSNHLIILCPPLLLLLSNFPNIRVFSNETVLPIRWPKYWSFSFRLFATSWIVACQDSPGKNTGVGCHALLQGILATQGSNPVLLHCGWILYCLSHQGSPRQVVLFQFSSVQLLSRVRLFVTPFLRHHIIEWNNGIDIPVTLLYVKIVKRKNSNSFKYLSLVTNLTMVLYIFPNKFNVDFFIYFHVSMYGIKWECVNTSTFSGLFHLTD